MAWEAEAPLQDVAFGIFAPRANRGKGRFLFMERGVLRSVVGGFGVWVCVFGVLLGIEWGLRGVIWGWWGLGLGVDLCLVGWRRG